MSAHNENETVFETTTHEKKKLNWKLNESIMNFSMKRKTKILCDEYEIHSLNRLQKNNNGDLSLAIMINGVHFRTQSSANMQNFGIVRKATSHFIILSVKWKWVEFKFNWCKSYSTFTIRLIDRIIIVFRNQMPNAQSRWDFQNKIGAMRASEFS